MILKNLYRGTKSCGDFCVISSTSRLRTCHRKVVTETVTFVKNIYGGGFEKIDKELQTILIDGANVLSENRA